MYRALYWKHNYLYFNTIKIYNNPQTTKRINGKFEDYCKVFYAIQGTFSAPSLVPRSASPHRGNLVAGYNGFGYLHLVQLAV